MHPERAFVLGISSLEFFKWFGKMLLQLLTLMVLKKNHAGN
jgi:hypothetical protein